MKRYIQIITLITAIAVIGCKKFLEVDIPAQETLNEVVFSSDQTAASALMNMYAYMNDNTQLSYTLTAYSGMSGDDLINYSNDGNLRQFYENGLIARNTGVLNVWTSGYNIIYQANSIYEGCNNSTKLTDSVKQQIMGEALFLRAFWHFTLVNLYGPVPISVTTDYQSNNTKTREPESEVYKQVIADLQEALPLLRDNYVFGVDLQATDERTRVTRLAANALLARVYLYSKDYKNAIAAATSVINRKDLYDTVNVSNVFLKNNKEAILQLAKPTPNPSNINTWEGRYYNLVNRPSATLLDCTSLSSSLLAAFESGDKRRKSWVGLAVDNNVTPSKQYYYANKYKVRTSASTTEYSNVIRIAEMYLIRAEASLMDGNTAIAISDVDVIRKRSALPSITQTLTELTNTTILNAILKERRTEFFTEWGHRWFDMKRTNIIDAVMEVAATDKKITWRSTASLWPIPQVEIQNNPRLLQNAGYN